MAPKAPNQEAIEISREDLYEQVWVTPINHLAEKFTVSGSYLARVCEVLNVPRPPVGYWQKKAVGKAVPRPELPVALPGDQLSWGALHRSRLIRLPNHCASLVSLLTQGISCESPRAIRDRDPRAIKDPILVLSRTGIAINTLLRKMFWGP